MSIDTQYNRHIVYQIIKYWENLKFKKKAINPKKLLYFGAFKISIAINVSRIVMCCFHNLYSLFAVLTDGMPIWKI